MEILLIFYSVEGAKQNMHRKSNQTQGAYASADEASGAQGDQMSSLRWTFGGKWQIHHLPHNVKNLKFHRGGGVIQGQTFLQQDFIWQTVALIGLHTLMGSFGHFSENYNDDNFFTLGEWLCDAIQCQAVGFTLFKS